jgi:formyltetrahydrofolate hydrolase
VWGADRGRRVRCEIPLVICNHPDHQADVEGFGMRYEHVPVVKAWCA